jgi:hypothetical protein
VTLDRYEISTLVGILAVWGGLEWLLVDPLYRRSVRWGIGVGLLAAPGLFYLYRRGLSGGITASFKAIGANMAYKMAVLVATPFLVTYVSSIHVFVYESLLFFVLFSLGFLAIYHARRTVT